MSVCLSVYLLCVCLSVCLCRSHYQRVHGKQLSLANTVHKMMADRELKYVTTTLSYLLTCTCTCLLAGVGWSSLYTLLIHCVSKNDTTQPPTIISTVVVRFSNFWYKYYGANTLSVACCVDELNQRLVDVWNSLQQNVIDAAINEWRMQLRSCVHADGQHFEHLLPSRVTDTSYGRMKYK